MVNPYKARFEAKLREFGIYSLSDLSKISHVEPNIRMLVLKFLASLAFESQHATNIELGRSALNKVPIEVLSNCFDDLVEPHLSNNDEWEYRRVAEFLKNYDIGLYHKHLLKCNNHADPDIREIAAEAIEPRANQ